ncbi:MAG: septum site-determining protein MinC [Gammaproteobacteria bacterium]|nr:septum site-determining protein MinC [Gammaproteobacteria bacterium]
MSLKLQTTDIDTISTALADKVQQAPGFFKDTPIVVDVSGLDEEALDNSNGQELIDCIKESQLVPIVASVVNKSSPLASSIEIPLIEGAAKPSTRKKEEGEGGEHSTEKVESISAELGASEIEYVIKSPMLVTRPVRSGQQLYARDTDLIVMGQVGPGAEVIADNHIHIYGPLRGRALCGVSGNTDTRIFCQSLEAELVSVAGNYRLLESIPEELRGKPAQIWLDKEKLNIEPL